MNHHAMSHAELRRWLEAEFGLGEVRAQLICWTVPGATSERCVRVWLQEAGSGSPCELWAARPMSGELARCEVPTETEVARFVQSVREASAADARESLEDLCDRIRPGRREFAIARVMRSVAAWLRVGDGRVAGDDPRP